MGVKKDEKKKNKNNSNPCSLKFSGKRDKRRSRKRGPDGNSSRAGKAHLKIGSKNLV